jgi:hypothetical protein
MTLSTGTLSLLDVLNELRTSNAGRALPIGLNDADVRALAGKPNGPIGLADLRGKQAASPVSQFTGVITGSHLSGSSSAGVRFSSDGTVAGFITGGLGGSTGPAHMRWFHPLKEGVGPGYWVRATLIRGSVPNTNAGLGVWLSLAASSSWITISNGNFFRESVLLFEVATNAAGSVIVASGTIQLQADWGG